MSGNFLKSDSDSAEPAPGFTPGRIPFVVQLRSQSDENRTSLGKAQLVREVWMEQANSDVVEYSKKESSPV